MAQIIKHRRGSLENLSSVTGSLQKGELIFATGSSNLTTTNGGAIAFIVPESGSVQATNRFLRGANNPNVFSSSTYNGLLNGVPYYASGSHTLFLLGSDVNEAINLVGNIQPFSGSVSNRLLDLEASIGGTGSGISTTVSALVASQSYFDTTFSSSVATQFSASSVSQTNLSSSLASRLATEEFKSTKFATTGSNTFIGTQIVTGSMYITNDLIVYGSSSLFNVSASILDIGDNTIRLNTATPTIRFAGIEVIDSGSSQLTGSLLWDSQNNVWLYSNPSGSLYTSARFIAGPKNTGSLGNETGLTVGYIPVASGDDHISNSRMSQSADTITIDSKVKINDVSSTFTIEGNGFSQTYLTANGAIVLNPGYGGVEMVGSYRTFKATDITAEGTLSASVITGIGNVTDYSTSVDSRLDSVESSIGGGGSLGTRVGNLETISASYLAFTQSYYTDSGSFNTRISASIAGYTANSASIAVIVNPLSASVFTQFSASTFTATANSASIAGIVNPLSASVFTQFSASTFTATVNSASISGIVNPLSASVFTQFSASTFTATANSASIATTNNAQTDRLVKLESSQSNFDTAIGVSGSAVTIKGNLTVQGSTTQVNSTTVNINDNIITLNAAGTNDGGIVVRDALGVTTNSGSLLWDVTNDYWKAGSLGAESKILTATGMNVVSGSSQIDITATTGYSTFSGSVATSLSASLASQTAVSTSVDSRLDTLEGTGTIQGLGTTNNVTHNSVTASLNVPSGGGNSKRLAFRGTTDTIEFVSAPTTTGDIAQWDGTNFVMSNVIDGGSF